jgi:N utilization substance protein A
MVQEALFIMKSDFMMAINQVCHERQLSLETVMEAVEVALASAYKRNYGANQITAKINPDDGSIRILVEKIIVETVEDSKNEISLEDAQAKDPEAELDGIIFVEDTPANFGRIAAQTTKQVILQRIREAERDQLYNVYAEREGEVVNGTVHKVDAHQVILSLGKVEAILPRTEQIPTERYNEGQRLRAYVSEVSKTPRGPQIIVSRTHRNMLRRLLEVEVPEIYNGTVEIKAIAREAGYRSKVAVAALQEGVDPVGSCVGMRGVRIQSIVNELGGEKIDVAQWNPDTKAFIGNALSPAKVLNVILQELGGDKTAMVVVPDRQLSLAIGKEGQNARLAAKLTGWRIDIKSAIEAAEEALAKATASDEIKTLVAHRPEVFSLASSILSEREENVELSQGELQLLSEAIELVGQAEVALAREKLEAERAAREAQRARLADPNVDLLAEAEAILAETLDTADEAADSLDELQAIEATIIEEEALVDKADVVEVALEVTEEVVQEQESADIEEPELEPEPVVEAEVPPPVTDEPEPDPEAEEAIPVLASILDEPEPEVKAPKKRKLKVVVGTDDVTPEEIPASKKRSRSKGRTLEFDEELGQVVVKRQRKRSRQGDWDEEDF